MVRNKPYPIRTCVVCGQKDYKSNLLRITCYKGKIKLDEKQRLPGRGAYVCSKSCLQKLNSLRIWKKLARSLRHPLEETAYKEFKQEIEGFLERGKYV